MTFSDRLAVAGISLVAALITGAFVILLAVMGGGDLSAILASGPWVLAFACVAAVVAFIAGPARAAAWCRYTVSMRVSWGEKKRRSNLKDRKIKTSDEHPEAEVKHIVRGIVRQGLEPASPKASISTRVDADVFEWFKSKGPGYQARINAVLKAFRDASV